MLVARFDSGLRIVYKPRSLAADLHFQHLLGWVGARADLTFRDAAILDRGTHGWMEFVTPASCESSDGVARFYERQGGHLAVLHLFNGSDLHCENVIAAGELPMLVDVEALFHARLPSVRSDVEGEGWDTSVLSTGLLPTPLRFGDDSPPFDRSGLGAPSCQLSPLAVLHRRAPAPTR